MRSALDATEQIECSSVDNVLPLALYGLCTESSIFSLSVIPSETETSYLLLATEDWKVLDTLLELIRNVAKQIVIFN